MLLEVNGAVFIPTNLGSRKGCVIYVTAGNFD